ncbi:nuclear transport factor 2 family protein [Caballeronia sp. GACF4]|uniref:YybH family protein n=1 Tax=Caballeronia sp. GACF4 TaxID=2921763 RepID=UPI0020288403|nr:nuclear transport factor 2 family protein [Caballeronia sp. GACF4]
MIKRVLTTGAMLASIVVTTPAHADANADKAAIAQRLQAWSKAFNARDAEGVCDIFAPDLVSTVPEALDGNRDTICKKLAVLFAKPGLSLQYDSPDIREIIVSGDIAIVRLFWTLTARMGDKESVTEEAGMDIFQRQPDGQWSIARFMSFSATPNTVLE